MSELTPSPGAGAPAEPSVEAQHLRRDMGEAGEIFYNVQREEIGYIVPEVDGTYSVFTRRKGIYQVVGVWRASDTKEVNNLYVGLGSYILPDGSFNRSTGKITLSSHYNYNPLEKVNYAYVHQEGLTDDDLDMLFLYARKFLEMETGNQLLTFNSGSKEWWGALKIARISGLLLLSTPGVLQQGYNLRIEEFALETKAWGEGMIAQFLWMQYQREIDEILIGFGCHTRFFVASRQKQFTSDNSVGFKL